MKASDLRVKDVINIVDGRRLGALIDVEMDHETGRIHSIVVPGQSKLFGLLGTSGDLVIPWEYIRRIGPDCILVEWDPDGKLRAQAREQQPPNRPYDR